MKQNCDNLSKLY